MLDPQKTLEREAMLKRIRELDAEMSAIWTLLWMPGLNRSLTSQMLFLMRESR